MMIASLDGEMVGVGGAPVVASGAVKPYLSYVARLDVGEDNVPVVTEIYSDIGPLTWQTIPQHHGPYRYYGIAPSPIFTAGKTWCAPCRMAMVNNADEYVVAQFYRETNTMVCVSSYDPVGLVDARLFSAQIYLEIRIYP